MSFSPSELSIAAEACLDFYLKGKALDQVDQMRPLLTKLTANQKEIPGGKQYVIENLRYQNQSNFQWYRGAKTVTYNKRQLVKQAKFEWGGWHDGFSLDEDQMLQNGIDIKEGETKQVSEGDKVQLANLMQEHSEALKVGSDEKYDQALHLDGTQDSEAIVGLDGLVSLTPSSGTVGGIACSNAWWQNQVALGLTTTVTTGNINDQMEIAWRKASLHAKTTPNCIMAGAAFIDALRAFMLKSGFSHVNWSGSETRKIEIGTGGGVRTGIYFKGVEIEWDPTFEDLDTLYAPATPWTKRCYMLNLRHLKLKPISGHDRITRKPPRVYDSYQYYYGLTWKGALTTNMRSAHAVLTIS